MHIDLDGILQVSAIEKATGLQKKITIENALRPMSEAEIQQARSRIQLLFDTMDGDDGALDSEDDASAEPEEASSSISIRPSDRESGDGGGDEQEARAIGLVKRSQELLERMHPDDREEAIDLHERIDEAIRDKRPAELKEAIAELEEIVYFIGAK